MRLVSWNVNGLRSVARRGFLDWLRAERPDVVALQEIKAHAEQVPELVRAPAGYHAVWHAAERPGYSGVATFSREKPLAVRAGLGLHEFDREGRVLLTEFPSFVLVNAYFPNSQRDHSRLGYKLRFCAATLRAIERLRRSGRRVIVCGDFNIAHQEIDLRNPRGNHKNAGFLPEERAWMDRLLARGWLDGFRQFCDEPGHYTWWSYRPGVRERNVGWRIDYFVVDPALAPRLRRVSHQPHVFGSDHCPISLELRPEDSARLRLPARAAGRPAALA